MKPLKGRLIIVELLPHSFQEEAADMNPQEEFFVQNLLEWFKDHGRHLPWRRSNATPYEILVAELMLKKTRAENVVEPFLRFITEFPTPKDIVVAPDDTLKDILQPLGLFRQRFISFKVIFSKIVEEYHGEIPRLKEQLLELPYVGEYTANAVLCFGYSRDLPIVDVNVTRVCQRYFGLDVYGDPRVDKHIWDLLERILPKGLSKEFNFALLDLGSLVCTSRRPKHETCPLRSFCNEAQKKVSADLFINNNSELVSRY